MEKCGCSNTSGSLVTSLTDLQQLFDRGSMPLNPLQVSLTHLDDAQNGALQTKLNNYIKACGCDTGSYFVFAGTAMVVTYFLINTISLTWSTAGYAFLVVIGFAFAGKTIGLIIARTRYFSLLRNLLRQGNQDTSW